MITLEKKFRSKNLRGIAEILSADTTSNEIKVKLTSPDGSSCIERWNYEHIKLGFKVGHYFYLNSENTEGVSDASTESGVLHDVGESHASGENCESDLASGELPLKKITEAKEVCDNCGKSDKIQAFGPFKICRRCWL